MKQLHKLTRADGRTTSENDRPRGDAISIAEGVSPTSAAPRSGNVSSQRDWSSAVNAPESMRAAMAANGIRCDEQLIADGNLHRFHVTGDKPGSKNGWYILYMNAIPAGAYGYWKTSAHHTWCARSEKRLTPAERAEVNAQYERAKAAREAMLAQGRRTAQERAQALWDAAQEVESHPYL